MQKQLGRNTVVLLGIGHTNAHVLRMWKMKPIENAQLVCISNFPQVTYSGMLPGVLAGQYDEQAMEIDLVRLTQSAGARLIVDRVVGHDPVKKEILFEHRPPLAYDLLSIGIGSVPTTEGVDLEPGSCTPIKPMQTFLDRLRQALQGKPRVAQRIVIVGGGLGSLEIAFCLQERFRLFPEWAGLDELPQITIVSRSESIGSGIANSTEKRVRRCLQARGIELLTDVEVHEVSREFVTLGDGQKLDSDVVIWATGATAPDLLSDLRLELDEDGFIATLPTLQSRSSEQVFAVGDSGTVIGNSTRKAGVYAVRQGPVLWENIQRLLAGRPAKPFVPQRDFLKLINLGDDQAIAEYKGVSFQGGLFWRLKNHIDVKFMKMYQDYRPMVMSAEAGADLPMKCLGCGGKVGSETLTSILDELDVPPHPDVIVGLENPDDAAIIKTHGDQVTVTTDFFAAPFDDPYLVGRIALLNSVSDCFVMGARPTTTLAMVQLPLGHPRAQRQVMRELMAGSLEELRKMDATIVGGHTIEGPRVTIGFTVMGYQVCEAKTKGMLRAGDQLILSKSLGTGALLAGLMQSELSAEYYLPLVESMVMSNAVALELIERFPVSALTDVTGFGLAGHLAEMLRASNARAVLNPDRLPILPGFRQMVDQGIQSTLAPDNRAVASKIAISGADLESAESAILFDPQTSGGLLLGVRPESADELVQFLVDQGFADSTVIGSVIETSGEPALQVEV
ncbi:MAG: selenide, water dikinase SelD [Mariniblastus sp.]|nr:selenide, water dikinase SelD [Mariniblastus sp.]